MARKDPRIVVLEDDLTTAGVAASSTDVVFVPGFANTNCNYLIYKKSGQAPDEYTPGDVTPEDANIRNISEWEDGQLYPEYACNTVDQITWKCTKSVEKGYEYYEWTAQDTYVEPRPENVPVLCTTLSDFETNFGTKPYQFTEDQDVSELFQGDALAKGAKYMYRAGDYEKSYIYAKELVRAGLPVVYENIVDRSGDGTTTIGKKVYARPDRTVTVTLNAETYEQLVGEGGQAVTVDKDAIATNSNNTIKWFVDDTDITTAITIGEGETVVAGDRIHISAKNEQTQAYTVKYVYLAKPEIVIDDEVLEAYLKKQAADTGSLSYAEVINCKYTETEEGNKWIAAVQVGTETVEKVVDLTVYGISFSDDNLVLVDDMLLVSAGYAETFDKKEPTVDFLYDSLISCFTDEDKLLDKGEFTVKYITSGAYPVYELVTKKDDEYVDAGVVDAMIQCAYKRGDAFAIIDHSNNPERSLKATAGSGSVYAHLTSDEGTGLPNSDAYNTFATMFTPWATYTCTTAPSKHEIQLMPASFAYLMGMAQSIVTHPNWLAIAGVNRGLCPTIRSLNTVERLTNTIADAYQPRDARALNAITNIKPYGLTIWGNRTLVSNAEGNLTGKSFLNIRSLICDIKKVAYTAAKSLLFEQNTEILWNKFKTQLTPTLDKMIHGYGLSSYKIIKATTKYDGTPLAKGEIAAVIRIVPIYAVEDFEITVVMTDEGVEVN